jgi:gluconate 2-dehydrogenase gamma chain
MKGMERVSRRDLLKAAGITAGAAVAAPRQGSAAAPSANQNEPQPAPGSVASQAEDILFFFNSDEAKFIDAAVERIIPADAKWGGAREAGVLYYLDRQLAGAYGAGAHMYLDGPWKVDAPPQQGYQLKHSPADLYHAAIHEVRDKVRSQYQNKEFWELDDKDMDKVLSALESGDLELKTIPSPVFFETLLANTIEGYFADPVHGGNRNMVSWRMIGFPGATRSSSGWWTNTTMTSPASR